MTDRPDMRITDADRRAAGERLRRALTEGRLDFAEYDTRLARAFGAVTYRDLDDLFADLPTTGSAFAPAPRVAVPAAPRAVHLVPTPLKVLWTVWLAVVAVNLTVWLLVSIGNGGVDYFWPIWLLVPGAALFGVTVGVVGSRGRDRRS